MPAPSAIGDAARAAVATSSLSIRLQGPSVAVAAPQGQACTGAQNWTPAYREAAAFLFAGQKLTQEGVQGSLQRILDYYRQVDIKAGQRKKKKPRSDTRIDVHALQQPGASSRRGDRLEEAAGNEEDNGARAGCDSGDPSFREGVHSCSLL